ncbi:RIP metalloprotease RseP [Microvirga sp. W0021]|uniref:Zinc metalloprotease n=2 Tax=Hohaiivirga grylli TaxID=3133970 RepID=A0ABV0BJA6_9HYPH
MDTLSLILMKLGGLFAFSTLFYLAAFIAVLSVIVFVHEYGHFIVGRWCGVGVDEFSIGFGREILGWTDKHGTRWKISWLPLGGYVRFVGDGNAASAPDSDAGARLSPEMKAISLHAQAAWKRALIVAAGPVANFIFAIAIYSVFFAASGKVEVEPRIDMVVEGGRAEEAGFKAGDLILSINGSKITDFSQVTQSVVINAEEPMHFKVERDGAVVDITAVPALKKIKSLIGFVDGGQLGFQVDTRIDGRLRFIKLGVLDAIVEGGKTTWSIIDQSVSTVGKLITGKISLTQLSGPVGIAQMTGKVAERGLLDLIGFAAFLSVSIGMVNLLPIPVLDGGHLLFCIIEMITRKPLNERVQEFAFRVGLLLILAVFVFATGADLMRNFTQ